MAASIEILLGRFKELEKFIILRNLWLQLHETLAIVNNYKLTLFCNFLNFAS